MTDYPDWQNALVFNRVIDVLIGSTINANSVLTRPASGKFNLVQPGYEFELNVATLGGTAPVVSVELQWYDSTFGALMDDEIYYFYSGNINGHLIHGRGPCKGDQLVIKITNYSGASAITVSDTVLQVPRVFTREFWKTITLGAVAPVFPGFTAAANDIAGNIVAAASQTVPATSSAALVLPFYTGTVRLMAAGANTAGMTQVTIEPVTDQNAGNVFNFQGVNGQSGFSVDGVTSLYASDIALPRAQCQMTLTNLLASSQLILASLVAQEDRT